MMTKHLPPSKGTGVPFAAGWLVGYLRYVILDAGHVAFGTFGLFVAVTFCITAFPVLARILTEKHLTTSAVCVVYSVCYVYRYVCVCVCRMGV